VYPLTHTLQVSPLYVEHLGIAGTHEGVNPAEQVLLPSTRMVARRTRSSMDFWFIDMN